MLPTDFILQLNCTAQLFPIRDILVILSIKFIVGIFFQRSDYRKVQVPWDRTVYCPIRRQMVSDPYVVHCLPRCASVGVRSLHLE